MSSNPHDAQTELHPPFFRGPTPPTSGSLGYPLQVGHEWMDTSGGIGVLRRCTAVDGGGIGTWALDGPAVIKLPLGDADTPGGVLAWHNPEGAAILITALTLYQPISLADPGFGNTLTVGDAADATTSSGTLDPSAGLDNNGNPQLTKVGGTPAVLAVGRWITASTATGSAAGLAGYAYIYYHLT